MRGLTGIELGAGTVVLVHTRPGRAAAKLSAVHVATGFEGVRASRDFPRRARVVVWGLKHPASLTNGATHALIAPVVEAGFHVDDVMSPADALWVLAGRRGGSSRLSDTAWLALNRQGAAIAIVCDGELAYGREFEWRYRVVETPREEVLQRYVLLAHLATELRHGLQVVGEKHGRRVDGIVTCGNLPDLRSLTIPLIEEFDMEVETLETLEGFAVAPALIDGISENAPALQLACAAAVRRTSLVRPAVHFRWPAAAAAVLVLAGVGAGLFWLATSSRPVVVPAAGTPPPTPSREQGQSSGVPGQPEVAAPPERRREDEAPPRVLTQPAATTGRRGSVESRSPETHRAPAARRQEPPPGPSTEPLPVVNSIVVTPDRRLAVLNGAIVREGEAVGGRVLIRIEPDAVVLRDRAGHEVRVPLRRRVG